MARTIETKTTLEDFLSAVMGANLQLVRLLVIGASAPEKINGYLTLVPIARSILTALDHQNQNIIRYERDHGFRTDTPQIFAENLFHNLKNQIEQRGIAVSPGEWTA